MKRPQLLDLFCGAGGAAIGYYCAGLEFVGKQLIENLKGGEIKSLRRQAA